MKIWCWPDVLLRLFAVGLHRIAFCAMCIVVQCHHAEHVRLRHIRITYSKTHKNYLRRKLETRSLELRLHWCRLSLH